MPIIAINVPTSVYNYYNSMKKGTRSKHFSNVLERHVRLSSNMEYNGLSYTELETVIQQREDAVNNLQDIITKLNMKLNELSRDQKLVLKQSFIRTWFKYFSRR